MFYALMPTIDHDDVHQELSYAMRFFQMDDIGTSAAHQCM
jgi:hypothetical protein